MTTPNLTLKMTWKDQIAPNEISSQKTTNKMFIYLLFPFTVKQWLKRIKSCEAGCEILGPKWPICAKPEFFRISDYCNFHALLAPFILLNLRKKLLEPIQSYVLRYGQCFSWQLTHTSYSNHFFRMLKDMLVQTLPQRRKITYHPLLVMYWLFSLTYSMQDVGHMLHLNVAGQLPSH